MRRRMKRRRRRRTRRRTAVTFKHPHLRKKNLWSIPRVRHTDQRHRPPPSLPEMADSAQLPPWRRTAFHGVVGGVSPAAAGVMAGSSASGAVVAASAGGVSPAAAGGMAGSSASDAFAADSASAGGVSPEAAGGMAASASAGGVSPDGPASKTAQRRQRRKMTDLVGQLVTEQITSCRHVCHFSPLFCRVVVFQRLQCRSHVFSLVFAFSFFRAFVFLSCSWFFHDRPPGMLRRNIPSPGDNGHL